MGPSYRDAGGWKSAQYGRSGGERELAGTTPFCGGSVARWRKATRRDSAAPLRVPPRDSDPGWESQPARHANSNALRANPTATVRRREKRESFLGRSGGDGDGDEGNRSMKRAPPVRGHVTGNSSPSPERPPCQPPRKRHSLPGPRAAERRHPPIPTDPGTPFFFLFPNATPIQLGMRALAPSLARARVRSHCSSRSPVADLLLPLLAPACAGQNAERAVNAWRRQR